MILRVSLIENKLALLRTYSEDLLVKSKEATTVKTRVVAVYLKRRIKYGKMWLIVSAKVRFECR